MKVLTYSELVVNSRINAKKYFLPMYAIWLVITPSIVTYMAGVFAAEEGMSAFEAIPWGRVLAFFALFGLIWPLTMVISPAFFESVRTNTKLGFFESFGASGEAADLARLGYFLFTIAWIGPMVHMILAFYFHKQDVSKQVEDPKKFGWLDYLAAFV